MRAALLVLGGLALAASGLAQAGGLADLVSRDPLELARSAARHGDDAVLSSLGADGRRERAAAVALAPHLDAAELALEPLLELAEGRDPELAPAATAAVLRIAMTLTPEDLACREGALDALAPAVERLGLLADAGHVRADLRAAAQLAAARLTALGPGE